MQCKEHSLPACGIANTLRLLSDGTHFAAWCVLTALTADLIRIAAQWQIIQYTENNCNFL